MSKCDIRSEFDCQNGISNVYIRCLAQIRMSKYDFEFQNAIFGPNSNVKIGFPMSKYDITETSPYKRAPGRFAPKPVPPGTIPP